jgi:hypothetical protein
MLSDADARGSESMEKERVARDSLRLARIELRSLQTNLQNKEREIFAL